MKPNFRWVGAWLLATLAQASEGSFDFTEVQAEAQRLSVRTYVAPAEHLPAWLEAYTYSQYQAIVYAPDHAWWGAEGRSFQLQFFHPGWLFKQPVQVHEVVDGVVRPIAFDPALFTYGAGRPPAAVPADLGFAGLRVHHALNQPGVMDELAVFLGASYFRSLAPGLQYGLSARGLALNSGEPEPEEFPRFTSFWVQRPAGDAPDLTVYALLDSPSVAGAYRFVIRPGNETVMEIKVALYFRRSPGVVGLAPLTSMFHHGENTGWSRDDFRPEVHDSDGLMLATGAGEWIWRPLVNPPGPRVSVFADAAPRGFGLLQRDREFAHYDDVVANYHLRPSAWVEPLGDWGPGAVRLVELHTPDETNDNIVAFWQPARRPAPGEPLVYSYRLHWSGPAAGRPPAAYNVATRQGAVLDHPDRRRFVVDFAGPGLAGGPGSEPVEAVVTVGAGARLVGVGAVTTVAALGVSRAVFELAADGSDRPVELRCYLQRGGQTLTETWSNLWTP